MGWAGVARGGRHETLIQRAQTIPVGCGAQEVHVPLPVRVGRVQLYVVRGVQCCLFPGRLVKGAVAGSGAVGVVEHVRRLSTQIAASMGYAARGKDGLASAVMDGGA